MILQTKENNIETKDKLNYNKNTKQKINKWI